MKSTASSFARRDVLRSASGLLALLAGGPLLSGCGGGSGSGTIKVAAGEGGTAAGEAAPLVVAKPEVSWLNFVLTIQYVGAQYYALAAGNAGLAPTLQAGVGVQGDTTGGRRVPFADPYLAQYATEFAADQAAAVASLRAQLGTAAAAQPEIDLSAEAFGAIGQATDLGDRFDPFASDTDFLLGALVLEHAVAGAYRGMLTTGVAGAAEAILTQAMGDAVYRNGLVRGLLATRADEDPALAGTLSSVFAALTRLEASPPSQDPVAIGQVSSSVTDEDGHPIVLTRSASEMFRLLYLNQAGTSGGLLPAGVNGVDLLPGLQ